MELLIRYFDSFDGVEREITVEGTSKDDVLKYASDVYGATERNIREIREIDEFGDWD